MTVSTGLVVRLEPVLFDTMFDSRAPGAPTGKTGELRDDLSLEMAGQLHLLLSRDRKLIKPDDYQKLEPRITEIKRMLTVFVQRLTAEG